MIFEIPIQAEENTLAKKLWEKPNNSFGLININPDPTTLAVNNLKQNITYRDIGNTFELDDCSDEEQNSDIVNNMNIFLMVSANEKKDSLEINKNNELKANIIKTKEMNQMNH